LRKQIRLLEPVGRAEGLGAEGALAVLAGKPLDTVWGGMTPKVASPFEGPTFT
jgi:hypothetical protein